MAFPSARIRLAKNLGRSRVLLLTCCMQSISLIILALNYCTLFFSPQQNPNHPLSWPASSAPGFTLYKPSTSPPSRPENGKQSRHQQTDPARISYRDGMGRCWTMKHYGTETQGRIFSAQMKDGSLMCMWKFFSSGERAEPCGVITQLGIYSLRSTWKGLLRFHHWSLSAMLIHVNYLQET